MIEKNDRLVWGDKTFATRLLSHLNTCIPNCAMGEEELEYLKHVAKRLQNYQIETVEEGSDEYNYLKNLGLV